MYKLNTRERQKEKLLAIIFKYALIFICFHGYAYIYVSVFGFSAMLQHIIQIYVT
jgi:hypothetical protein